MYKFWVSTSSTITMQGSCAIKYQKNLRSSDTKTNSRPEMIKKKFLYINLKQIYLTTMYQNGGG